MVIKAECLCFSDFLALLCYLVLTGKLMLHYSVLFYYSIHYAVLCVLISNHMQRALGLFGETLPVYEGAHTMTHKAQVQKAKIVRLWTFELKRVENDSNTSNQTCNLVFWQTKID